MASQFRIFFLYLYEIPCDYPHRDGKSPTMNEKKRVNCCCSYPLALLVNDFDTVNRIVGWVRATIRIYNANDNDSIISYVLNDIVYFEINIDRG